MGSLSRCSACGTFVQEEDRFCWSCGSPLGPPAEAARPRQARPPTETSREVPPTVRRAYLAQHKGNLAEAERLLREALDEVPDSVPALSMLSEVLRARGDLVGAVAAAQQATEVAGAESTTPGAVERAREARAKIENGLVRELTSRSGPGGVHPLSVLASPGDAWYRSRAFYAVLMAMGVASLFAALVALLRGESLGYIWFGITLLAAGWCYHDAETRMEGGLVWGSFVLFLGPFGLVIYLLTKC